MVTTAPPAPVPRARTTLALALATASASAPAIVGLALIASLAAIDNVGWSAAAGFASGAVLVRADRRLAFVVGAALCLWFATLVAQLANGSYAGSDVFDLDLWAAWWHLLTTATAAAAFVAGCCPRRRVVVVALLALLGVLAALWSGFPHARGGDLRRCSHLALAGGAVLCADLGARRRAASAIVVMSLAALQYFAVRNLVLGGWSYVGTIAAAAFLAAPYLAGGLAAEVADGAAADDGARLVVVVQRRPWITSLLLAAALVGLTGPWAWRWYPVHSTFDGLTLWPLVLCFIAFIAHVGRGGRSSSDRLAPWLAANMAALVSAFALLGSPLSDLGFAGAFCCAVAVALWPLVAAVLMPGEPPGDGLPVAARVLPALVMVFPPISAAIARSPDYWTVAAMACLPVVPIAFHAAVRSRLRSATILGIATLFGCASQLLAPGGEALRGGESSVLVGPVAWTIAGLLVVAARRARSMTAVPLDHPIVEDLAGS